MLKKFSIYLIKFYQYCFSYFSFGCCRFTPTCSQYSIDALKKYPFYKAAILIVKRVVKCNPFGKCGYDPIPETSQNKYKK